jgi:hypothetical protein
MLSILGGGATLCLAWGSLTGIVMLLFGGPKSSLGGNGPLPGGGPYPGSP